MNNGKGFVKTKDVVGVSVKNPQKEDLGEIEEIILSKVSGTVCYVVLSFGGFLGLGDKYFAIPWNSIHYDTNEDAFILNLDKEKLKNAPGFDKDHWPDLNDPIWGKTIDTYYR